MKDFDEQSLETVWNLLFEGWEFVEDEHVEIVYDPDEDGQFKKAIHVPSYGGS